MNSFKQAAGAAALCCGVSAGWALEPASACGAIQDNTARLACYDLAHGRPAVAPAEQAATSLAPVRATASNATLLSKRWDLDGQSTARFAPQPYRPVYLLPVTWTDRVNRQPSSPSPDRSVTDNLGLSASEAKYQLSLKVKLGQDLLGASLWGAYTQSSRWQVYNGAASRPFRETNYEPELMLVWPLQQELLGWRLRMGSLGVAHQSNGRSLPLSRSWNRIVGTLAAESGDWVAEFRPWLRINERPEDDDNPDIQDFVGRGEFMLTRYLGEHALTLQMRHSLRPGARSHGSAQLDWVFPINGVLHGYFQYFGGYGESMVDYNLRQNKVGLGVTIAGWR